VIDKSIMPELQATHPAEGAQGVPSHQPQVDAAEESEAEDQAGAYVRGVAKSQHGHAAKGRQSRGGIARGVQEDQTIEETAIQAQPADPRRRRRVKGEAGKAK
jgi:hypothetical protein